MWYITPTMRKRSSKHQGPEDLNEIAYRVYEQAVGENVTEESKGKNPAAVELGRLGGKRGGTARAAKLTAERRSEIARRAAAARWAKR